MSNATRPICSALVVDDESAVLSTYENALKPRRVFLAHDVLEAVRITVSEKPELALVDCDAPGLCPV